jgi:hypothetical protein
MRKKTEPRTQQHPTTSRAGAEDSGLIAKGETTPQSDREECALDNRSHRTTLAFTGEGPCAAISGVHENMPGPSSPASNC